MKNKLLLPSVFIFLSTLVSYASICPGDTARFTSNAPKCKSDIVNFTDASTIAPGDGISSWKWNFGDPGSGGNNTSILQNPGHLYSAGGTFSVKLVVTYTSTCKDSITILVGIQSLVVANAGINITSCKNNLTVNLLGTIANAGGGHWFGSGNFSNPASLTPIYTPTTAAKASGTDTVVLTSTSSPFCPNVSDTVVITFNTGPIVNVGPNISVCKDTSGVPVLATIANATGGTWHTLGTGGTFANATSISTIYTPSSSDTAAGSVILYMESSGNGICLSSKDSVTITFTSTPTVVIKTNDSACSRSPIILDVTVSTGAGFWTSSGTGTFTPNNTGLNGAYHPSAADDLAGHITLKFTSTNNGGCHSAFDTLVVTIKPSPTAAYTSVIKCAKLPIQFTDASTGTIDSWTWDFDDLSPTVLLQNPLHTYVQGGPYNVSLIVRSTNGCKDTSSQLMNVFRLPTADFTASGVCMNSGTVFTSTSTVTGATISSTIWNFGDLTTSTLPSTTHFFSSSASFPVKLVVQSSEGCLDSIVHTVPVEAGPTAAFTISDNTAIINQQVIFTDQSTSAISLSWNFGDLSARDTLSHHPSHYYSIGGYYDVCLTVTDASGCFDTFCQQEIVSTHPSGPSGFSPNGDGQNDVFYVYGGPFKTLAFKVYNGWGELIFESDKQSNGWDGKRNGVDQPIGVYVYTIFGTTEDGNEYKISGDVTLLR